MTREIPLTRGLVAVVDDEDFDWLNQWKWQAGPDCSKQNRFRARRSVWAGQKRITVWMHRIILDDPAGLVVDHINGDPLDNRRANLRACSRSQNQNAPAVPNLALPGYTVSRTEFDNRWLGEEQSRRRAFQFGVSGGHRTLRIAFAALEHPNTETTCLASEGRAGRILRNSDGTARYTPKRDWARFCELQGLPADFLADAPLTNEGRYRVVGNGVPLPMGRAVAAAVLEAIQQARTEAA